YGAAESCSEERIKRTWASLAGLDEAAFGANMEFCESGEAIGHLLRVASGLDSMVIGEEQVLGQVRHSIAEARECGASGRVLNTAFDRAVRLGARVRQATGISRGGVSVGSMAVRLAEEAHGGSLEGRSMLLIGTGELATLVAKSLSQRGYAFGVASRTLRRAEAFCGAVGGTAVKFEDALGDYGAYSVVFVATVAPYFMVTAESLGAARREGPMMIVDLSNPRTVDERVAGLDGVRLVNLDEIAGIVERNMRDRESQARAAEGMVAGELGGIEASVRRLGAEPLIADVFRAAEAVRARELAKALAALGDVDEQTARTVEELTRSIMEGIVSGPIDRIRRASEGGDEDVLDAASRLFGRAD
ncbi:MAG: glutamyl-tRNA reductase, partial [Thaumarchaeota archaeon S15]